MPLLPEIVRPYLWLAALAFMVGFVSYLALGRPAAAAQALVAAPTPISFPTAEAWNIPKRI